MNNQENPVFKTGTGPKAIALDLRNKRGDVAKTSLGVRLENLANRFLGKPRYRAGKTYARNHSAEYAQVDLGRFTAQYEGEQAQITWVGMPENLVASGIRDLPGWIERASAGTLSELDNERLQFLPDDDALFSFSCTCLAWPGPCAHVCAAMALMVQTVEDVPHYLLALRGIDIETLQVDETEAAISAAENTVSAVQFDPSQFPADELTEVLPTEVAAAFERFYKVDQH